MDIQTATAVETTMLKKSLDTEKLAAELITSTIDRLNTGTVGLTPVINQDYAMQKSVLSAAYSERGIGTKLDIEA